MGEEAAGNQGLEQALHVDLPQGGQLILKTQEEVDMWDRTAAAYIKEYKLSKTNDLILLGAILSQNLTMFRAQLRLNGMVAEKDAAGVPTGRYKEEEVDAKTLGASQGAITKASEEIRALEKALGIDKKTREAGGAYNIADYITTLKKAGHEMGIHVSGRLKFFEETMMEARWKIRLLRNGDPEDRQHHNVSEDKIIDWLEGKLAEAEQIDIDYAKTKGHLYLGKL
jgi:hypothetical protein